MSEEKATPDAPVFGFRRWNVNRSGELTSIGVEAKWASTKLTAECRGFQRWPMNMAVSDPRTTQMYADSPSSLDFSRVENIGGVDTVWVYKLNCANPQYAFYGHKAPSRMSQCGIWAHKLPIRACMCGGDNRDHGAAGVVKMWGRAVEHEDGWRSEFAEIVALHDFTGQLNTRQYDVSYYSSLDALYSEWAPDHGDEWASGGDAYWALNCMSMVLNYGSSSQPFLHNSMINWSRPPIPIGRITMNSCSSTFIEFDEKEDDDDDSLMPANMTARLRYIKEQADRIAAVTRSRVQDQKRKRK